MTLHIIALHMLDIDLYTEFNLSKEERGYVRWVRVNKMVVRWMDFKAQMDRKYSVDIGGMNREGRRGCRYWQSRLWSWEWEWGRASFVEKSQGNEWFKSWKKIILMTIEITKNYEGSQPLNCGEKVGVGWCWRDSGQRSKWIGSSIGRSLWP